MLPRFLRSPICFEKPERLTDEPAWQGHIPFAFAVVDLLRPKLIVELGAYKGDSYCAFCQAVEKLKINAKCYAVDTWEGDVHTGKYSGSIYEELRDYHNPKYGRFSTLVRSTFDEALPKFRDGSIDLLHIDGCHTYKAVKHDFESWLPKMSKRGVILFHDTNCHLKKFGVWRLWGQLRNRYPSFEFKHGSGLGVLAVGPGIPEEMKEFFALGKDEPELLSEFFARLGALMQKPAEVPLPVRRDEGLLATHARIYEVEHSLAWRIVKGVRRLVDATMPPGSRRRAAYHMGRKGASALLKSGPVIVSRKVLGKAKRHALRREELGKATVEKPPEVPVQDDYAFTAAGIAKVDIERRKSLVPVPPRIISCETKDLDLFARSLHVPKSKNPAATAVIRLEGDGKGALECLASIIERAHGLQYEVIFAGSPKGQAAKALRNVSGISFAGTASAAAKRARGEFLVFIADSAQAEEGLLRQITSAFAKGGEVGAVAPKALLPGGRLKSAGGTIEPDGSIRATGYCDDPKLPRFNYAREVECCPSACFAVRRKEFLGMGGFARGYRSMDYAVADLCMRLREKGRKVLYCPNAVAVDASGVPGNAEEVRKRFLAQWRGQVKELNRIRLIAFYLPQFYPIPENDRWWGKGFTEWTNVTKAKPSFEGHYQPHLPGELGFYDLRLESVMDEQAKLAKEYGIYGFCYHYYWLGGKRMLELPLERLLKTGKPDMPFCLCWANHHWSRAWDGADNELLIAQNHTYENDCAVIRDIIRYMRHPNYIRVGGKPMLLVFQVTRLAEPGRTAREWRRICREEGIGEIFLVMCESRTGGRNRDLVANPVSPEKFGFDAVLEFPPHADYFPVVTDRKVLNPAFKGIIWDYRKGVLAYFAKAQRAFPRLYGLMPSWDNTPRRQNNPQLFINSSPGSYRAWLEGLMGLAREQNPADERFIFINAWNEWAEGTHLEPDRKYGRAFLEATKKALGWFSSGKPTSGAGSRQD